MVCVCVCVINQKQSSLQWQVLARTDVNATNNSNISPDELSDVVEAESKKNL